jgi:hypothetical protein
MVRSPLCQARCWSAPGRPADGHGVIAGGGDLPRPRLPGLHGLVIQAPRKLVTAVADLWLRVGIFGTAAARQHRHNFANSCAIR